MRKLILASLTISSALAGQTPRPAQAPGTPPPRTTPLRGSLERRLTTLLDQPPFNRATWNVHVVDDRGRVLFSRNAERFSVPASNTKLVVSAAAAVLLPPDYRVRTSLYANGTIVEGVLEGDLILYGRGDPTWSQRCFGTDTLAAGVCDSTWTAVDAIADSVRARGIRRISGRVVGDGSYFEPVLTHWNWGSFDLNWWYAAPVSGLGFHDNSADFQITPGAAVDQPPTITWSPDLHLFAFENRARTGPADSGSTIGDNFFRKPGTMEIWAEGTAALGRAPWIESFALPDPNLYAARALAAALQKKGVSVEGGAASTTDSMVYRGARQANPLAEYLGRPLPDILFPILNTSQNWFAEMLLKILGRELGGAGSWEKGLDVEKRFLIDSVKIDSTAFALDDGSGLSAGNLVTPRAFVQLLDYMYRHPKRGPFLAALPRSAQPGSLLRRFTGTPFEGRVLAKTGSIFRVNSLSGYVERADGRRFTFSIQANGHSVPGRQMLAQIDSLVVEIGKTK
ncbi:MAG TPA: D-alanyl-D-alanine carboxypeptidase/D-alanyl-D-alanine-endopeptidase [Gemmatimonadales bacterium]|jgi:D-alanyl-D-alanine carboxypeptidase/D-alanyl-D-alanine-endopeptidase (penicillin-binding protein 4)|nr:D-alanyl-D-alanine carboxypeptidase/D-alanyl-D-alanine-endopeptidase [Gemmatimonadales bacterium]